MKAPQNKKLLLMLSFKGSKIRIVAWDAGGKYLSPVVHLRGN